MEIRRRVHRLPMHFEFKKKPKTIVQQTKPIVQSLILMPSSIVVPYSEPVTAPTNIEKLCIDQIEEQVKLHQQIVAEWDSKMELMRTQEIQMRRADIVRELNTLIEIWNNANP
jgi:hypothetical protein